MFAWGQDSIGSPRDIKTYTDLDTYKRHEVLQILTIFQVQVLETYLKTYKRPKHLKFRSSKVLKVLKLCIV